MKAIHIAHAAFAAAVSAVLIAGCEKRPELHIYTWSDYISPDVIEKFEKAHSCKVVVDTFDSNESMYSRLRAGEAGYDLIMPSSYFVARLAREGLIAELDHSKLPNVRKNLDKSFAMQIIDPSFMYNVPYAVTYTGFMYDKGKVPADAAPTSWSALSNPALRGRMTLLDDIREVIGGGLMSLGFSVNSRSPEEIDAAVKQVLKWKSNMRKFDVESYKSEVASGATLVGHAYSTDATQVIVGDAEEGVAPRPDIGFALPKEGFVVAFDEMVVSASAPSPDLAHAFINFVYDGEIAKENMEYLKGPMPVKPGIDALDEGYRRKIVLDGETLMRGQLLRPIDDDQKVLELYNKAWERIKAAEVR